MTTYEKNLQTSNRFLMCYSVRKMKYLKDKGFYYLFKCINERSNSPFWVFDLTDEIRTALSEYTKPNNQENKLIEI